MTKQPDPILSGRSALITGITGQDGSYLAELLLEKGYHVFGLARRDSWNRPNAASHLEGRIEMLFGDIVESVDIFKAVYDAQPDEVYSLASQSRPGESWARAAETLVLNSLATIRLFDAVRTLCPQARIYNASSSEMFGRATGERQNEETPFHPVNPYAAAKVYTHQMAGIYRESYGLYVASGILFNHESERRPLHFLTQKVAYGAACAACGITRSRHRNERGRFVVEDGKLALGNLDVARDWGYAPDFVRAMWLILQQDQPADFVIGTGRSHSLRELCAAAYQSVGLDWREHVLSDASLIRPVDSDCLVADPVKARDVLGWSPAIGFEEMIGRMVTAQVQRLGV